MFGAKRAESTTEAIAGQKLKDLAERANIPIRYSCMQGTCHLCDVKVDGVMVPACTASCPPNDCTIEYMDATAAAEYAKATLKAERAAKKGSVKPTKVANKGEEVYVERESVSTASLEDRLRAEMGAKKPKKKGWF